MLEEVRREIKSHLLLGLGIFVLVEAIWLFRGSFSTLKALLFFVGVIGGSFLLDSDHFLYWFFLYPQKKESLQAKTLWQQKDWRKLLALLGEKHRSHLSLVFHHFYFQAVLNLLALFVVTSTSSPLGQGIVLGAAGHLLKDEWEDFRTNPKHLQQWLLARTPFSSLPLPSSWLRVYLLFYSIIFGGLLYAASF
ncbi:hypothetical protein J7J95_00760 [bacterium]|nr:hypothetical protein [bacterium]